jgi:Protein of unknown function (DUF3606)
MVVAIHVIHDQGHFGVQALGERSRSFAARAKNATTRTAKGKRMVTSSNPKQFDGLRLVRPSNINARSTIDVTDKASVQHWARQFGISPLQLCCAVDSVGADPTAVKHKIAL